MNMFKCNIRWCCPIMHGIVSHGAVSHGIDQDVELDDHDVGGDGDGGDEW